MRIIIEVPDEVAEMFGDMAGALQTIAQVVTVKVEKDQVKDERPSDNADETKEAFDSPFEADLHAEDEQSAVTLEDARAKLADLAREGKRDQVKSLIREFGAQKLTEIPKEKLPDLIAKAEAIA